MTYTSKNAVTALNSYLWKLLEANLGWSLNDYAGAKPIIPVAQQPEMMQAGKPFIVYNSSRHPSDHLYALVKETVSYAIYSTTSTETNQIANLIADVFARQDEAADDVQRWLAIEGQNRGIQFGTVRTIMTEKARPADEEGGFAAALVMVEIKYTHNNTIITRPAAGQNINQVWTA